MVPIHDSDLGEERWATAEWKHYELWEKIEVKLKRRRNLWILGTVLVFLVLSSIPILVDHWPKWVSLKASRKLGQVINELKRTAGTDNQSLRLSFAVDGSLNYTVSKVSKCTDLGDAGIPVKTGNLLKPSLLNQYLLLTAQNGEAFGIPGLVQSFCYDPLAGSIATSSESSVAGFGVIPAKDLTDHRTDRLSLLIFKGPLAEVSFGTAD